MKTQIMSLRGVVLFLLCIFVLAVALAEEEGEEMIEQAKETVKGQVMEKVEGGKELSKRDMDQCVADCVKGCQNNVDTISSAIASLDAGSMALEAGDVGAAKDHLQKARGQLESVQQSIQSCMEQMPVINQSCPITGLAIDRMSCPTERTRMYKDMKVGFCCGACPGTWDKLSESERDEKLGQVSSCVRMQEKMQKHMEMVPKRERMYEKGQKKMSEYEDL